MRIDELDVVIPLLQRLLDDLEQENNPPMWVTVRIGDDDVRLYASGRVTINPQKHLS